MVRIRPAVSQLKVCGGRFGEVKAASVAAASIGSLKVMTMWTSERTPPSVSAGDVDRTVGGAQSPADAVQCPLPSQVSAAVPLQRVAAGVHSPPHTPCPVQTNWQRVPSTQAPPALQVCGVWSSPHCFAPGGQVPEQTPAEHTDWQA